MQSGSVENGQGEQPGERATGVVEEVGLSAEDCRDSIDKVFKERDRKKVSEEVEEKTRSNNIGASISVLQN